MQLDRDVLGDAKRQARIKCDYTYKSLDTNINEYLDHAGCGIRT